MTITNFKKFLKSVKILEQFEKAFENHKLEDVDLKTFVKENDSSDLIANAFKWVATDDGYNFWDNIDKIWQTKRKYFEN